MLIAETQDPKELTKKEKGREETANEDHVMGDYGRLLTDEMKG